jgi:sarcosine oxidase subunit alpha
LEENEIKKREKNNLAVLLYNKKKRTISYSSKLGRPRGVLCFTGSCPNCMMTVDSCSNVKACQYWSDRVPVVKRQGGGTFGGILSSFRFANAFHRFIPAGFQYHTLYSSKAKRRLFYSILKKFTGLGGALSEDQFKSPIKNAKRTADLLVIGGGAAGISAAMEGSSQFQNVLLVESLPELGGQFYQRWNPRKSSEAIRMNLEKLEAMKNSLEKLSNVKILLGTTVAAFYRIENTFLALSDEFSYEIQAENVAICTGDHEILPIFDGNDSPRVMLSTAAQVLSKSGVDIGSRILVLDMDGKGIEVALHLKENGTSTLSIARSRGFSKDEKSTCSRNGITTLEHSLVSRVQKNGNVFVDSQNGSTKFQVDLLVVSGRRQPNYELALQLGCTLACSYQNSKISDISTRHKLPVKVSLGGRLVNGKLGFEETIESGRKAITNLAINPAKEIPTIGIIIDPDDYMKKAISDKSLESFICMCEDVSSQEFLKALEEGYDWVESIKRYTGVLTGPCQGKQCALTVASILAETTHSINQRSQNEDNVNPRDSYKYFTTIRQPLVPVALAFLSQESGNPR